MLIRIRWAVAATSLCAALASAQTPPPPPPAAAPPPADAPVAAPEAEPPQAMMFRVGGGAGLGAFFPGPQFNLHLFDLHAGLQVNRMFGAYLRFGRTAGIGIGASVSSGSASATVSASGFWLIGANAELSLGDSFFIAAGPQVGIGGWAAVRAAAGTSGASAQAIATEGPQPGLDFRIGFGLGGSGSKVKTARRSQFTLTFDLSMLYASRVVDASASAGTQGATVSVAFSEALSYAPTIQLGYELR